MGWLLTYIQVLKDSGVFEYTWTELELWLSQLTSVDPNQQETVIQFLERVSSSNVLLTSKYFFFFIYFVGYTHYDIFNHGAAFLQVLGKLVSSSYTYTDKVASLVQEAAYVQTSLSSQEADAASIPVSHIDGEYQDLTTFHHEYVCSLFTMWHCLLHVLDVIDMLDVIMEGNEGEMEEFGPSLSEDLIIQTFPFSVLVPAALEARNKLPAENGKHLYQWHVLSQLWLRLLAHIHCEMQVCM